MSLAPCVLRLATRNRSGKLCAAALPRIVCMHSVWPDGPSLHFAHHGSDVCMQHIANCCRGLQILEALFARDLWGGREH